MKTSAMKIWNFLSLRFVTIYGRIVENFLRNFNDTFFVSILFWPFAYFLLFNFNAHQPSFHSKCHEIIKPQMFRYFINKFNGFDKENVESPVMIHEHFKALKKISRSYIEIHSSLFLPFSGSKYIKTYQFSIVDTMLNC